MLPAVHLAATELVLAANQAGTGTAVLGQSGGNGTGAEYGKSAPIALVIILALLIGLVLLIRSMNRHVRKMPENFDPPAADAAPEPGRRGA